VVVVVVVVVCLLGRFCAVYSVRCDVVHLAPILADFGFNEEEKDRYLGCYISAAFFMVGAPAALLFGYLSDTVNRKNLLFAAVLLGEKSRK
jgi:MFS family permease